MERFKVKKLNRRDHLDIKVLAGITKVILFPINLLMSLGLRVINMFKRWEIKRVYHRLFFLPRVANMFLYERSAIYYDENYKKHNRVRGVSK